MNKTSIYYFSLAAIAIGSLASCQDYDPLDESTLYAQNYKAAFVEAFGEIDPEQNWGFDPMPVCVLNSTRGSNTNSNEWISHFHYKVPGPRGIEQNANDLPWGWCAGDVTNYERAYVYWWFSTHQWPKTQTVNWNNFFLENVWGQPEHSRRYADGSAFNGSQEFGMDDLHILTLGNNPTKTPATTPISNWSTASQFFVSDTESNTKYEQTNNYNAGGGAKEQVMYLYDVSTADFTYKASYDNQNTVHNNWTIQQINGNYYLAFDYWHNKSGNNDYAVNEADGFYNDWILKLSSGEHQVDYYTRRIMCEDLGDTFDWDFNDVVFDVTVYTPDNGNTFKALITLQAAGGTLPIYVGDMDHEAHAMFGVATNVPVNVNAPGNVKRPAVVYTIDIDKDTQITQKTTSGGTTVYYCKAETIPVYVPSRNGAEGAITPNGGAIAVVPLKAEKGNAPQKFACASNVYWMQERTQIEKGHKNFWTWVADRNAENADLEALAGVSNVFVTSESSVKDFNVLYADLGKPSAVSYNPVDPSGYTSNETFVEWKTLWNNMVAAGGLNNSDWTADRICMKGNSASSDDINRPFYTQAPYIYETANGNDDPIAFSSALMNKILEGNYDNVGVGPFEKVWPETSNE